MREADLPLDTSAATASLCAGAAGPYRDATTRRRAQVASSPWLYFSSFKDLLHKLHAAPAELCGGDGDAQSAQPNMPRHPSFDIITIPTHM
jgi:hypothetical protein